MGGDIEFANDRAILVRVYDTRYGDSFDPPAHHLGVALTDVSPANVARLAFICFTNIYVEAEQLAR